MKKVKLYFAWQHKEEEAWLDQMAKDGYVLRKVTYPVYHFEYIEDNDYICRLECFDPKEDRMEKIEFYEECGYNYIGRCLMWHYFQGERSTLKTDQIFTELTSEIAMLKRNRTIMLAALLMNVVNIFNILFNPMMGPVFKSIIGLVIIVLCIGVYKFSSRINELKQQEV